MSFAVELHLDHEADTRVREIWGALDEAGVPSLAGASGTPCHPHVSLTAFDGVDIEMAAGHLLEAMATCTGMRLQLGSLGFFMTEPAVAFLGVVPTEGLLASHRRVVAAAEPHVRGFSPYYLPDALLPHCTLAMGVSSLPQVVGVVVQHPLPILATVSSVHLVDASTGEAVLSAR